MMKYLQNCNRNGVQGFLKCVWELFNGLPDLLKARNKYFGEKTPGLFFKNYPSKVLQEGV